MNFLCLKRDTCMRMLFCNNNMIFVMLLEMNKQWLRHYFSTQTEGDTYHLNNTYQACSHLNSFNLDTGDTTGYGIVSWEDIG